MKKILICFSLLITILCSCNNTDTAKEARFWVWMHGNTSNSSKDWKEIIERLHDIGFDAILFEGDIKQLKQIIPIAAKYDIEVHKWLWIMNVPGIEKEHPEWLSVNREGYSLAEKKAYVDYYKFLCPSLPEVKEYLKNKITEYAKIRNLKGIHMDYIRYVDVILPEALQPTYGIVQDREYPEYDYGYHPHTRALYNEKYGIDPMDITDPAEDNNWKQFRYNLITDIVTMLKDVAHEYNKDISSAVFPSPSLARKIVRQDWGRWPLDYVFPMVYQGFYNKDIDWIGEIIKEDISATNGKMPVFCGLYLPQLKGEKLSEAIDIAFESGAKGVAIFDSNGINDDVAKQLKSAFIKYR